MKANALAVTLSPFKLMANRHALSSLYKTLELTSTLVRGCSSYGLMEIAVDLGLSQSCYVDATTFLSVLDSMPKDKELKLSPKEGVLDWKCGTSKGRLALAVLEKMPVLDVELNKKTWKVIPEFGEALELGAMSCDDNTLAAVGMNGITIDNRQGIAMYSTDNITISYCSAGVKSIPRAPDIMTLSPEAAKLLSHVTRRGEGRMQFDEKSIYFFNDEIKLYINQIPKLRKDISEITDQFDGTEQVANVPPQRVSAFIKRVGAIAESRKHAHVGLKVTDGRIALSFAEGTASSDEYFLVDGLVGISDVDPIQLNAEKVARALAYIQTIVVDYLDRGVIVMRGDDPQFFYMIAGKSAKNDN